MTIKPYAAHTLPTTGQTTDKDANDPRISTADRSVKLVGDQSPTQDSDGTAVAARND
jgi:hypothetical protein